MEEVRKGGYVIKREAEGATLKDSFTGEFTKFREETQKKIEELEEKIKKHTGDIHGIKMQLGRQKKQGGE